MTTREAWPQAQAQMSESVGGGSMQSRQHMQSGTAIKTHCRQAQGGYKGGKRWVGGPGSRSIGRFCAGHVRAGEHRWWEEGGPTGTGCGVA